MRTGDLRGRIEQQGESGLRVCWSVLRGNDFRILAEVDGAGRELSSVARVRRGADGVADGCGIELRWRQIVRQAGGDACGAAYLRNLIGERGEAVFSSGDGRAKVASKTVVPVQKR